jgi:hypothetical protein
VSPLALTYSGFKAAVWAGEVAEVWPQAGVAMAAETHVRQMAKIIAIRVKLIFILLSDLKWVMRTSLS